VWHLLIKQLLVHFFIVAVIMTEYKQSVFLDALGTELRLLSKFAFNTDTEEYEELPEKLCAVMVGYNGLTFSSKDFLGSIMLRLEGNTMMMRLECKKKDVLYESTVSIGIIEGPATSKKRKTDEPLIADTMIIGRNYKTLSKELAAVVNQLARH
jgi:hypothetical protein